MSLSREVAVDSNGMLLSLQAIVNMISNPVNSTVPVAAESLKKLGVYDKKKVMGVTTLDVVSIGSWISVFMPSLQMCFCISSGFCFNSAFEPFLEHG